MDGQMRESLDRAYEEIERLVEERNEARSERDALTRQLQEALTIPKDWKPTADSINALPDPIRRYIHDLETRCDPAGEVIELGLRRDQARELEAALVAARSQLQEVVEERDRPIPMILHCPHCTWRHIDEGSWATRPHKTHLCLHCKHEWRPCDRPTVGVESLTERSKS